MPYQDGKGPEGTGPTGRRMGPCGDGEAQNNTFTYGYGRGRRGRGSRGHGRSRGFRVGMRGGSRVLSDAGALQAEKSWLEKRLNLVNEALKKTSED